MLTPAHPLWQVLIPLAHQQLAMERARTAGKTEYMQSNLDKLKRKHEYADAVSELETERMKAARLGS